MNKIVKILIPLSLSAATTVAPFISSCSNNVATAYWDITKGQWRPEIGAKEATDFDDINEMTDAYFEDASKNMKIFAEDIVHSIAMDSLDKRTPQFSSCKSTVYEVDQKNERISYRMDFTLLEGFVSHIWTIDVENMKMVVGPASWDLQRWGVWKDGQVVMPAYVSEQIYEEDEEALDAFIEDKEWSINVHHKAIQEFIADEEINYTPELLKQLKERGDIEQEAVFNELKRCLQYMTITSLYFRDCLIDAE